TIFEESLLVTGFPYELRRDPDTLLAFFRELILRARGIRRDGSAALDLCYVACGRFDAFWEIGLHPWDMAAGSLLINEAGGRMTNFSDQPHNLAYQDMLASNGQLHAEILRAIAHLQPQLHQSPLFKAT
ncbi:inositol monophosphatase, partial [bacterium]|nr:inositol monophosphatase [bacterium]